MYNRHYFFGVFQANEGKREASEERFPRRLCLALLVASACLSWPEKLELTSPVMQATGVKEIGPIMLVS